MIINNYYLAGWLTSLRMPSHYANFRLSGMYQALTFCALDTQESTQCPAGLVIQLSWTMLIEIKIRRLICFFMERMTTVNKFPSFKIPHFRILYRAL